MSRCFPLPPPGSGLWFWSRTRRIGHGGGGGVQGGGRLRLPLQGGADQCRRQGRQGPDVGHRRPGEKYVKKRKEDKRTGQENKGLEGTTDKLDKKQNCRSIGRVQKLISERERRKAATGEPSYPFSATVQNCQLMKKGLDNTVANIIQNMETLGSALATKKESSTSSKNVTTNGNGSMQKAYQGRYHGNTQKVEVANEDSVSIGTEKKKILGGSVHNIVNMCNTSNIVADGNKKKCVTGSLHGDVAHLTKMLSTNDSSKLPLGNQNTSVHLIPKPSNSLQANKSAQNFNGVMSRPLSTSRPSVTTCTSRKNCQKSAKPDPKLNTFKKINGFTSEPLIAADTSRKNCQESAKPDPKVSTFKKINDFTSEPLIAAYTSTKNCQKSAKPDPKVNTFKKINGFTSRPIIAAETSRTNCQNSTKPDPKVNTFKKIHGFTSEPLITKNTNKKNYQKSAKPDPKANTFKKINGFTSEPLITTDTNRKNCQESAKPDPKVNTFKKINVFTSEPLIAADTSTKNCQKSAKPDPKVNTFKKINGFTSEPLIAADTSRKNCQKLAKPDPEVNTFKKINGFTSEPLIAADISRYNWNLKPPQHDPKVNTFKKTDGITFKPPRISRYPIDVDNNRHKRHMEEEGESPRKIQKISISSGPSCEIKRIPIQPLALKSTTISSETKNIEHKVKDITDYRASKADLRSPASVNTDRDEILMELPHSDNKIDEILHDIDVWVNRIPSRSNPPGTTVENGTSESSQVTDLTSQDDSSSEPSSPESEDGSSSEPSSPESEDDSSSELSSRESELLRLLDLLPKFEEVRLPDPDEDWLFSSKGGVDAYLQNRSNSKPKENIQDEQMHQVWDKPIYIESIDTVALPYVVPF